MSAGSKRSIGAFAYARLASLRARLTASGGRLRATRQMAGAAFMIRVFGAGIVFVSQAMLARWMGEHAFGNYVYVWTWLLLLGDLFHFGLPLTAQRYIPQYTEAGALPLLRGYLQASRWIVFLIGAGAAAVGLLVILAARGVFDRDLVLPLVCGCVALPFFVLTFMSDALARSYDWVRLALLPAYIVRPLGLIVIVGLLHFAGLRVDDTTVLLILAIVSALVACGQTLLFDRWIAGVVPRGPKQFALGEWLRTAAPIVLVWGMYTLLTSTDVLVLKHFRPAEDVGHYFAAAKILALVSIINFSVGAAAAHQFTRLHVAGDRDGLSAFAADTVKLMFWPSLAVTLCVLALGRPLLMLFGPGFAGAYPIMAVLAVGQLARAAVGPAERLLNMVGQQNRCALAYLAAFAVNIVGCVTLAPRFGGMGAAAATAAAFVTEAVLLALIAKRSVGVWLFVWRPKHRSGARFGALRPQLGTER